MGAVYPNGIVPWINRVDLINTVYAADPNSLAAEIIAIETTVGTNPQIESAPPVGNPVTYSTLSARVHDVQMGNQLPVCTVVNQSFEVHGNSPTGVQNSYSKVLDPFGMYNGTDITVKTPGWYDITATQGAGWASSGYAHFTLNISGVEVTNDFWNWDFPANQPGGQWRSAASAPGRGHIMSMSWQGIIQANQRISVSTENGTGSSTMSCSASWLRVSFRRAVTAGTQG
jgi:hypothetical protein